MVPSLFILASFVFKSLPCLISTLTQGGEGGHLFRLTCSVALWGGRCTASKYHWRVGSAHSVWATLGLPSLMACVLSWSTLLRLQVALQGNCLKRALGCVHFPQIQVLRYSTKAQTRLGLCFVPFPGLSSSGDQVLGECTIPGVWCVLSPPQSQPLSFLGVPQERYLRCAMCLLWGSQVVTLLADVNRPGSREDFS